VSRRKEQASAARTKVKELRAQASAARAKVKELRVQVSAARSEIKELKAQLATSEAIREQQRAQLGKQQEQIETLGQEAHRQAAPFRVPDERRKPEGEKKRPGREKGHQGSYRKPPQPFEVTDTAEVPLDCCPHCQGPVNEVEPRVQFIDDVIVLRRRLRLTTYRGICPHCGRVHSTHPEQVSTATGAAGTHIGGRSLALAAVLNKQYGVTMRNTCGLLGLLGLSLSPGGLSQALDRVADKLEPYMQQVREGLRKSVAVNVDETGWWVGGLPRWLWAATSLHYTIYDIGSRASAMVTKILGDDFPGVLVSDCLSSYDPHPGTKSKCVAHHLRAIADAIKQAPGSEYLDKTKSLFKASIVLHDLRKDITDYAFVVAGVKRNLAALLDSKPLHPAEIAVQNRLLHQRPHLLTFLDIPGVEPTNNAAERALRPAVITRKVSAGNKTERGVRTFTTLKSLAVTCLQQHRSFPDLVAAAMSLGLPPPPPLVVKPDEP